MENRTFIWGLICIGIGIFGMSLGHMIIGFILAFYGAGRIQASTLPEDHKTVKALFAFLIAVVKVIYYFVKENIFRIKPKNK